MSDTSSALAAIQAAERFVDASSRVDAFERAARLAMQEHDEPAQALAQLGLFEATARSVRHEIDMGSMMWLFEAADRGLLRGSLLTRVLDTARRVLWQMRSNAAVPLRTIYATLTDLERRYDMAGCSPRKLHIFRTMMAVDTGTTGQVRQAHHAWQDAPFGQLGGTVAGDCAAQALVYAELGDYHTALLTVQQLQDHGATSDLEPLAQACSLDWLVRHGELDCAVDTHISTWRTARAEANADLCVSHHLAFLARMGRADRALELGLPFFTLDVGNNDDARMRLLAVSHGVLRLAARRGIAPRVVHGMLLKDFLSESLQEAMSIAEQFDHRNSTDKATYLAEQLAYLTPYPETTTWPQPWNKPETVSVPEPEPITTDSFVELGSAVTQAVRDFSPEIWSLSAHWATLRQRANPMLSSERKVAATLGLLRVVTSTGEVARREWATLGSWVDGSYDRTTSLRHEAFGLLPPMSDNPADWHQMMPIADELVTLGDYPWVCLLLRRAAAAWEAHGEIAGAVELCQSSIELAHDTGLAAHEALSRTDVAGILARAGQLGAAQQQLNAAEDAVMFESANTTTAQWRAQAAVAAAKHDDAAYAASLKAAIDSAPAGAYAPLLAALQDLSKYHRQRQDYDAADQVTAQMRALGLAEGSDEAVAAALHAAAITLIAQDELTAGMEKLEACLALRSPGHEHNWSTLTVLATTLDKHGDYQEAAQRWREASDVAVAKGNTAMAVLALQRATVCLEDAGDSAGAVAVARQALDTAKEQASLDDVVSATAGLAEALAAVDETAEALQIVQALPRDLAELSHTDDKDSDAASEKLRSVTAHMALTKARVLLAAQRWGEALIAAEDAEEQLGEFSLSDAARAVVLQAEAMQNLGRTDDARQILADALTATDDDGAVSVLTDARRILQEIIDEAATPD